MTHLFRIRGVVTGLMATFSNILSFAFTKEYYNLETQLSLPGVTLLIAILLGIGLVTMYMILPETRKRSLEDIEIHYSGNHQAKYIVTLNQSLFTIKKFI